MKTFFLVAFLLLMLPNKETAHAQTTADNPFGKALVPDMIADASIIEIDGIFYCYATTDGYGRGLETSGPPVVWKSPDFVHWSFQGSYFPEVENEKYWAPSKAIAANGKYYIYPTINGFMYPGVADSPNGPFRLAKGNKRLLQTKDDSGIDAEVFIDDDGQAYLFWGRRHVALLNKDMVTVDTVVHTISTPHKQYSEGPIFFKRKGIYYYLYTIGGDEQYQYAYVMSKVSPLGPYEFPPDDIISSTNHEKGVFGPGHGCVFHPEKSDDYYFAFLEFGRRSTNRQTYVNRLLFRNDGTIQPISVDLNGVGALRKVKFPRNLPIADVTVSSTRPDLFIEPNQDPTCLRTEHFVATFATDGSNSSRWMSTFEDKSPWIQIDLGKVTKIKGSDLYFVRPTAGHSYRLEGSIDGKSWKVCGGHSAIEKKSPHQDTIREKYRYLRATITNGVAGVWEWNIY